ncbi:MAG: transposase [Clostridia bacterium]
MAQNYNYTEEFKKQIVNLRESGKPISEIVKEYGIAKSTVSKWHNDYIKSGSFKAGDNISSEEKELKKLRKENKRLLMEVDILKQAALIMGRKGE